MRFSRTAGVAGVILSYLLCLQQTHRTTNEVERHSAMNSTALTSTLRVSSDCRLALRSRNVNGNDGSGDGFIGDGDSGDGDGGNGGGGNGERGV